MPGKNDWWRSAAFYQIYPRSFLDSNGDGVGDLKGITQKLDYVASLGVEGVWISPFFKSPMKDFGYDVSDYRDIDPLFGTLKDFDVMLAEMHKRGLKLVVDLVLNHTSVEHPWFKESRASRSGTKSDWYVWADPKADGTAPNNWLSVFGGPAWQFETKRGQYYQHSFLPEQPDLNVLNPEVQEALLDTLKFWLDKGVDGFRLDAISHFMHDAQLRDNPPKPDGGGPTTLVCKHAYNMQRHVYDMFHPKNPDFLRRMRKLTDKYDARMMVGEVGGDEDPLKHYVEYTGAPDVLHTAYNFSFLNPECTPQLFRETITTLQEASSYCWPAWAFSNHDFYRSATRWKDGAESPDQVKMLIALLCALRGTPFIYQGEELGLPEAKLNFEDLQDPFGKYLWPESQGRDGCRTPMPWHAAERNAGFSSAPKPWLPVSPAHFPLAVDAQEKDAHSTLNFTRRFLKWRKTMAPICLGKMAFIDLPDPLLGFVREHEGEKIVCVFNLKRKPVTAELPFAAQAIAVEGLRGALDGKKLSLPEFGAFFGKI